MINEIKDTTNAMHVECNIVGHSMTPIEVMPEDHKPTQPNKVS